jgi:hypothetical protein
MEHAPPKPLQVSVNFQSDGMVFGLHPRVRSEVERHRYTFVCMLGGNLPQMSRIVFVGTDSDGREVRKNPDPWTPRIESAVSILLGLPETKLIDLIGGVEVVYDPGKGPSERIWKWSDIQQQSLLREGKRHESSMATGST